MTQEQKMQAAAMNAKGEPLDKILKTVKADNEEIKAFLKTRPKPETRGPREYHSMTTKERAKIAELYDGGMKQADISRELGIPKSSVSRYLISIGKGKNTKAKKEPAQAATCTDSEARNCPNISTSDNTTKKAESQALSGISGLSCMESALDEWLGLGQEAEIVSVRADQTDSELVFEHEGEKYIMAFGRYGE